MLFNSWQFLIFFPIVTAVYFILRGRPRNLWLLAASCVFYMAFIPQYVIILVALILIDFFAGQKIANADKNRRKLWLITSLVANLTILGVFKYFNFFNTNISAVASFLDLRYPVPFLQIILPIGLSFHTFQAMSYTIEVYRRRQRPEKSLLIYALYVMFYPQLVAGPIERPQNLIHQFKENHRFEYDRVVSGLRLMLWGLFKKVVIADRMAVFANQVFSWPYDYSGPTLIVATLFFAFQIFCDFSGYSDIAIGAAQVMGIKLMKNFNSPYFATSISDFWSRWHISLSTWFRDYVYIPLGGNRVKKIFWVRNVVIVFGLSGLWHGANWTFLIWGLLHGAYYLFFAALDGLRISSIKVFKLFSPLITFILVSFAWIFFRANNLSQAIYIVTHLFHGLGGYLQYAVSYLPQYLSGGGSPDKTYLLFWHLNYEKSELEILLAFGLIAFLLIMEGGSSWFGKHWSLGNKPILIRWAIYLVAIIFILNLGVINKIPFIYFQF